MVTGVGMGVGGVLDTAYHPWPTGTHPYCRLLTSSLLPPPPLIVDILLINANSRKIISI